MCLFQKILQAYIYQGKRREADTQGALISGSRFQKCIFANQVVAIQFKLFYCQQVLTVTARKGDFVQIKFNIASPDMR